MQVGLLWSPVRLQRKAIGSFKGEFSRVFVTGQNGSQLVVWLSGTRWLKHYFNRQMAIGNNKMNPIA